MHAKETLTERSSGITHGNASCGRREPTRLAQVPDFIPRAEAIILGGFAQLRPLVREGVRCRVVPPSRRAPICYSRFYTAAGVTSRDKAHDEEAFAATLVKLAQNQESPPVLFYGDDDSLAFICRHRERLQGHFRFHMPESTLVESCSDKVRFLALAAQHALPVPKQLLGRPDLDGIEIERVVGYPCALKPNTHVGWFQSEAIRTAGNMPQKILLAHNRAECEQALVGMRQFTDRFVVQEFVPGGEDRIYSFHAYVPRHSHSGVAYVGQKIRTYPAMGGESTLVKLVKNEDVMRLGWEIVRRLGICGVLKIDFKQDVQRSRFRLLEINLRFNLWNQLGAVCGINLPYLAYLDNCGLAYEPAADYRTDIKWLNFAADVRSFIQDYLPAGIVSPFQWLASYRGRKVYSLFAWNDPLPFFVSTLGKVGRILLRNKQHPE